MWNKDTLTSSFHVCIPFISCICCIILSKALIINCTAGWKVSILVLFLMLMEMLWVFLSLASCWFGGFCLFPSEFELCPVLLDSLVLFIMTWCWILSQVSSPFNDIVSDFDPNYVGTCEGYLRTDINHIDIMS